MSISEAYTGSAGISSTEYSLTNNSTTLTAINTSGIYQVFVDFTSMVAGDQYQIRVYEKVRSSDTQHLVYQSYLTGAQSEPVWVCPSLVLINGWEVTLKELTGSPRTITWSIRQVS